MKLIFNGRVDDSGKTTMFDRKRFENEMVVFKGKDITITVEKKKRKRSNDQNAYYHGVVVPMVANALIDIGYRIDRSGTHEFLKHNFNRAEMINESTGEVMTDPDGKPMIKILSTSGISTTDFMGFIAAIQQWAAEYLNIVIPDPNSQTEMKFEP